MTVPPRVLVALGVSVIAALVLAGAWLGGGGDDPSPTTTTTTTSTPVSTPAATIAPTPIAVLPDWYRKASSRYQDRRPSTVPPERSVSGGPGGTASTSTSTPSDDPDPTRSARRPSTGG